MISIVLPSFNGEKYIEQSIRSIINQSYKNWELIIVDDCSSDNTGIIAEQYAKRDMRIRVIHNLTNKKLPMSLNIGFAEARGDFFTWTSDDNAYEKNALKNMLTMLKEQKTDFIFADYMVIDPDDYILFSVKTGPVEELLLRNCIGACFLYKKEIHNKLIGYDTNKFLVEDYDFWLRAYRKYKFFHLEKKLYFYRYHNTSLTTQKSNLIRKATKQLLRENLDYVKDDNLRKKIIEKIKSI